MAYRVGQEGPGWLIPRSGAPIFGLGRRLRIAGNWSRERLAWETWTRTGGMLVAEDHIVSGPSYCWVQSELDMEIIASMCDALWVRSFLLPSLSGVRRLSPRGENRESQLCLRAIVMFERQSIADSLFLYKFPCYCRNRCRRQPVFLCLFSWCNFRLYLRRSHTGKKTV
jgi:hypothetical protein